jgi:hypothetical protein
MTYTNLYNQIDTQDDFINCDRFLDIEADLDTALKAEKINLLNAQNND